MTQEARKQMPNQNDARETVVRDTITIFLLLAILAGFIIILISEQGPSLPEATNTPVATTTVLAATSSRTPAPRPSLTRTPSPARTSTRTVTPAPVGLRIYLHVLNPDTVAWLKRE